MISSIRDIAVGVLAAFVGIWIGKVVVCAFSLSGMPWGQMPVVLLIGLVPGTVARLHRSARWWSLVCSVELSALAGFLLGVLLDRVARAVVFGQAVFFWGTCTSAMVFGGLAFVGRHALLGVSLWSVAVFLLTPVVYGAVFLVCSVLSPLWGLRAPQVVWVLFSGALALVMGRMLRDRGEDVVYGKKVQ